MKRQLWRANVTSLAALVGLLLASEAQAQFELELFLQSYPNASITVDGDASDWDLHQFSTVVVGGVVPEGIDHLDWERLDGTGDIAMLGWDDAEQEIFYGGLWTTGALPEDRADNSVKFYARDNATHQYFLVDITEDEINTDDPEGAAWANDSVEFYFDPSGDRDLQNWDTHVQLVIDAGNQVQVWNAPPDYELQVEAGVTSAVTITETGWLLEVGVEKGVFDPPLPVHLGAANDPDGNNYGIDLAYRDNDDPDDTGTRNGDPAYTTAYIWADPFSGGGFPSKQPDSWGQMIAGAGGGPAPLWAGDADMDYDFDQLDLVQVQIAAKYLTASPATWGEGDWNGAPGGAPGSPPQGNGLFDQIDIIAALGPAHYLTGPYNAIAPKGVQGDGQTSIVYNAETGEVGVDAPAGTQLTSINIDSAAGIFTGDAAQNLGGSFDNDADDNIFKATFGSQFGSASFGNVAQAGLSEEFVATDLSVVGSLAGGGGLGDVDLVYIPEPSTLALMGMALAAMLQLRTQRRGLVDPS